MCTSIYFKDKNLHVTTVRALADELGVDPLKLVWGDADSTYDPLSEEMDHYDFKYCLCPIDIEQSLKQCGYSGGWSITGDPMVFEATPT
jgi:hypothetical protein